MYTFITGDDQKYAQQQCRLVKTTVGSISIRMMWVFGLLARYAMNSSGARNDQVYGRVLHVIGVLLSSSGVSKRVNRVKPSFILSKY